MMMDPSKILMGVSGLSGSLRLGWLLQFATGIMLQQLRRVTCLWWSLMTYFLRTDGIQRSLDLITPLDPLTAEFAVKVSDSADDSRVLLRHPVMSRAFYEQHGLFDDAYRGVYCDDDITRRAFWRAAILDGRSIVLHHQHPSLDKTLQKSESQSRINSKHEYRHGREQYLAAWRPQQRLAQVRLVETGESSRLSSSNLRRVARLNRALAIIVYRRCQLYRRLKHPLSTARGLKRRFSRRGRRMTGR